MPSCSTKPHLNVLFDVLFDVSTSSSVRVVGSRVVESCEACEATASSEVPAGATRIFRAASEREMALLKACESSLSSDQLFSDAQKRRSSRHFPADATTVCKACRSSAITPACSTENEKQGNEPKNVKRK